MFECVPKYPCYITCRVKSHGENNNFMNEGAFPQSTVISTLQVFQIFLSMITKKFLIPTIKRRMLIEQFSLDKSSDNFSQLFKTFSSLASSWNKTNKRENHE